MVVCSDFNKRRLVTIDEINERPRLEITAKYGFSKFSTIESVFDIESFNVVS